MGRATDRGRSRALGCTETTAPGSFDLEDIARSELRGPPCR